MFTVAVKVAETCE